MDIVKQFLQLLPHLEEIQEELMKDGRRLTPRRLLALVTLCHAKRSEHTKATIRQTVRLAGDELPANLHRMRHRGAVTDVLSQLRNMGLVKSEPSRGKAYLYHPAPRVRRVLRKHTMEVQNENSAFSIAS